jgi:hypothetical protein
MKIDEFDPHLKHVLEQMCSVVEADPTEIDFKEEKWFWKYEWSIDQEKAFIKWLADYLYSNKGARAEILETPWRNRKHCEKAAKFFVWNYGWKYDE